MQYWLKQINVDTVLNIDHNNYIIGNRKTLVTHDVIIVQDVHIDVYSSAAFERYTNWETWDGYKYMKVYQGYTPDIIYYEFRYFDYIDSRHYTKMSFEVFLTSSHDPLHPGTLGKLLYTSPSGRNYSHETHHDKASCITSSTGFLWNSMYSKAFS